MTVRLLSLLTQYFHSDACSFEHGSNLLQAFRGRRFKDFCDLSDPFGF